MNEFVLINKYLKPLALKNPGALKLADDIFFDSKKKIAISLDTYVEGVHFVDAQDPDRFLKKILRASLSDLYSKGIKPKSYFLSLGLNKKLTKLFWLKKIKQILSYEQKKFNIMLSGGDTVHSSKLVITIVVMGHCKNIPVLRIGSSLNDDIYVTGNIGDSSIGLSIIKKKYNFGKNNSFFLKKYYEPDLPIKISPYLHKFASSSIDISDGLVQDLQHLCFNSKHGASINLNLLPLSLICKNLIKQKKIKLKNIFSRGDDYQTIFTSHRINRSKILALSKKLNIKISRIGLIKKEKNIICNYNMKQFKLTSQKMGYIHNFK